MLVLVLIGLVVLVALSVVALRLQKKVWAAEKLAADQVKQAEEKQLVQRESMNKSIQILSQGVLGKQLSHTEAAIRIGALLEFLDVSDEVKEDYSAFFQLAESTSHIPILEKWKSLSPKEQRRYDEERAALEEKYGDFIVDAAQRIQGQQF